MKKILIGGSPCTHWSIVRQKKKTKDGPRESTTEGIGWELFRNYIIAMKKFNPDFFLYENNESASKSIQKQIEKELGVELLHFNSSLVSAQNRKRIYGSNSEVNEPEDRKIMLSDVIENDVHAQRERDPLLRSLPGVLQHDTQRQRGAAGGPQYTI